MRTLHGKLANCNSQLHYQLRKLFFFTSLRKAATIAVLSSTQSTPFDSSNYPARSRKSLILSNSRLIFHSSEIDNSVRGSIVGSHSTVALGVILVPTSWPHCNQGSCSKPYVPIPYTGYIYWILHRVHPADHHLAG